MPVTDADIRKLALSHDGVSEIDHFERPAFRTKARIFAVIRPDGLFLHLPQERKEFLFEADPRAFVKFMWGKRANVIVQPARIAKKELAALIAEAWEFNRPPPPRTKTPAAKPKPPAKPKPAAKPARTAKRAAR